jgi:hypothetical protein
MTRALALAAALGLAGTAGAQQQIPSKVDLRFNRFVDADGIHDQMFRLAEAHPELCRVERIGTSSLGRPVLALVICNPRTGDERDKPAMYIDGSIHANEIQASETVTYSAWYLLGAYGTVPRITELVDRCVFLMVPLVNPDGRASWFAEAHTPHSARSGQRPTDSDGDGTADEDGPDDLDGDGHITMMWRRDPFGTHRRDPRDPDRMERVSSEPRADGTREYGDWSMAGQEGIDNDGDGRTNEDGAGGYDMNRNFPSGWEPENVQGGAGAYPLCFPETRAVADWVLARPNVAAAQCFHNTGGMILRGPGAPFREKDYPGEDVATYRRIQETGASMLPFYRPMVIHKDLYTVHGGAVNWFAEGLGVISLTNELWTEKRLMQDGQDPSEEERRLWDRRMLFDQAKSPLKEMQHPEFGTVLVGGGTKFSARIPPPFMVEEELHRNFAFTMYHADQMPLLRFESADTKELSPGLWEVTVTVANDRLIPTRTARAADRGIGTDDVLELSGAKVVAGGRLERRTDRTFDPQEFRPHALRFPRGVPGQSSVAARFLVEGAAGTPITLRHASQKATDIELATRLGDRWPTPAADAAPAKAP